jgi:hypothetical protein
MTCPKCGYILEPFDEGCPRCTRAEEQHPEQPQAEQPTPEVADGEEGPPLRTPPTPPPSARAYQAGPLFATATCEKCRHTWALNPPLPAGTAIVCPSCQSQLTLRNRRRQAHWAVLAVVGATFVLGSLCCGLLALTSMFREPMHPEVPYQQPSAPATYYQPPATSYQQQPSASYQQRAPQGETPQVVTQEEQDRELAYQRELQRQAYLARQAQQQGTYQQAPAYGAGTSSDTIVYVTDTGEKYHRSGCPHLRGSSHPMAISEAQAQGYTACSDCF